jgi:hypothetical protein
MRHSQDSRTVNRRRLLGAGAAFGGLALAGCAATPSGPSIGRVVVVGGGFGGATVARYLRLWGGNVDVTLVERNAQFVSCPISNMVLGGHLQMADITRGYGSLQAAGVKVLQGEVVAIDVAGRKLRLAGGGELAWDRLVLSPGIDFMFDLVPGLTTAARQRRRHARLEGRPADGGAAPPARIDARRRRVRDGHPEGALPLPARALRTGLHGGQLPEGGQAEVQAAGARRQPRDPVARRPCSSAPSSSTTTACWSTGRTPS